MADKGSKSSTTGEESEVTKEAVATTQLASRINSVARALLSFYFMIIVGGFIMRALEQNHEYDQAIEARRQEDFYRNALGLDVKSTTTTATGTRRRLGAASLVRGRQLDLEDDIRNLTETVETFILAFPSHGQENSYAHAVNASDNLLTLVTAAEERVKRAAEAATNLTEYLEDQLEQCKGSPPTPEDLHWNLHGSMWFVFTILTSAPRCSW